MLIMQKNTCSLDTVLCFTVIKLIRYMDKLKHYVKSHSLDKGHGMFLKNLQCLKCKNCKKKYSPMKNRLHCTM